MKNNFKRLFQSLFEHSKLYFLLCLIIVFLQGINNMAGVLLPRYLVDFLASENYKDAFFIVLLLCIVTLLLNLMMDISEYRRKVCMDTFHHKFMMSLVKHVAALSYENYEKYDIREKYRLAIKCATENSAGKILNYLLNVISAAVSLFALFNLVSYTVWWLWIILIISIVINTLCEAYRIKYNVESYKEQNSIEMHMLYARDRLPWKTFAKEVRLFSMYDYVVQKANFYIDLLSSIQGKQASKTFRALFWSYLFNGLQMAAVYGYVAYQCFTGEFSIGSFTMLTLAILNISKLTSGIASNFMEVRQQLLYLENYYSFLDCDSDREDCIDIPVKQNVHIKVDNVTFTYPGAAEPALKNISYTFEPGKKYGIVGANGSGKTTFVHLLMGLYTATEGNIFIEDIPVQQLKKEQLYDLFSSVLQDYNIYSYTVKENIMLGQRDDEETLKELIEQMQFSSRFEELTHGVDTYISKEYSDAGTEFSGGEQQKIAILRAFYKNAPILVLDEPTSALSPQSEFQLYTDIEKMAKGKSVFFISHRMASCKMCDEILVFNKGQLVEKGSHSELMNQKGLYYEMFLAQINLYTEQREDIDEKN